MEVRIQELEQQYSSAANGVTREEMFVQRQNVYVSCFEELVRQVSVDCREQAMALEEVWNKMIDVKITLLNHAEHTKCMAEKAFAQKIAEVSAHYTELLNDSTAKLVRLETQVQDRDCFIEKQVLENRYLRKKDRKLEKLYKVAQIELTYLQDELNAQIREYLKYLMSHEELTWREALDYQRRYYEISQTKKPSSLKNIKQISLEVKKQLDMKEAHYKIVIILLIRVIINYLIDRLGLQDMD